MTRRITGSSILMLMCVWMVILECSLTCCAAAKDSLRVLILSGQNNHKWQETTPALVAMYQGSGAFAVDVLDKPRPGNWPDLDAYDVVVSNWTNWPSEERVWGEQEGQALLDFVRGGKGFVIFHAASACFSEWEEYQELIGATWGKGITGHGSIHRFPVTIVDNEHPVTRGLSGFVTRDELWHRMPVKPDTRVLARAYSAEEQGGIGTYEPVIYITPFGAGRSFNCALGHDATALKSVGCRLLMLRGTQWAATGKVSLEVPVDISQALKEIKGYRRDQKRDDLNEVEELVQFAEGLPSLRKELVKHMIKFLSDDSATVDSRTFVLDKVAVIATEDSAAALAVYLNDPDIGFAIRSTLQRIPGEAVTKVLCESLSQLEGLTLLDTINALGLRRDPAAVSTLRSFLDHEDTTVTEATIAALGQIGGAQACSVLQTHLSRVSSSQRPALGRALLQCAANQPARAQAIYEDLLAVSSQMPDAIRRAAFIGLVNNGAADQLVVEVLQGNDRSLIEAALHCLRSIDEKAMRSQVAKPLPSFPSKTKVQVIDAFADAGDTRFASDWATLLNHSDESVRLAVINALGTLGSAAQVSALMSRLATNSENELSALRASLACMGGQDVDRRMIVLLESSRDQSVRRECVRALAARRCKQALPQFQALTLDSDIEISRSAIKAIGELGDIENGLALLKVLLASKGSTNVRELEEATARVTQRVKASDRVCVWIAESMGHAEGDVQAAFLRILGRLGDGPSLAVLRHSLIHKEPTLRRTAQRVLSQWPDPAALPDLLRVVRQPATPTLKVLAIRAIARLYSADGALTDDLKDVLYAAMSLAERPDEKKVLLSTVTKVPSAANLPLVLSQLEDPAVVSEASLAALAIAEATITELPDEAETVIAKLRELDPPAAILERVLALELRLHAPVNLALQGVASSPDGWEKDGAAGGDRAGIDGDPATYWDEVNGKDLYRYQVSFSRPTEVSSLSITGFQHHNYAPRDFDVLCDDRVVKSIRQAQYSNNTLWVVLPVTSCQTLELRITGYYGASPAIRELRIYKTNAEATN